MATAETVGRPSVSLCPPTSISSAFAPPTPATSANVMTVLLSAASPLTPALGFRGCSAAGRVTHPPSLHMADTAASAHLAGPRLLVDDPLEDEEQGHQRDPQQQDGRQDLSRCRMPAGANPKLDLAAHE